jgi:Flp pilus assembly pilin Flp
VDAVVRTDVVAHRGRIELRLLGLVRKFGQQHWGQDLIEYGLLIGVITLAAILAVVALGGKVAPYFSTLEGAMP